MSSGLSFVVEPQLALAVPSSPESHLPTEAEKSAQQERRFRRILLRKQQQGDLAGMAAAYIHLGDLLLARGDSEEAGEHYRRALDLSRQAHERRQALARP
jgi:tetratricopeptide (TPR) repeat protein